MYELTLTRDDRQAIDWIGDRYSHGDDLARLIHNHEYATDNEAEWADNDDITYVLPEHVAWAAKELIEADELACFGPELTSKLWAFCDQIV